MNKSEENSILGLDSTKSSLSRSGITSDISASFMPLRRSELQQELQFSDLEEEQNEKIATKENQQNELNTRVSTININIIPPIEDVVKTPARKDITTWSSVNSYNNIAQTTPQSSSRNMGNFMSQSVNRFKTPQTIMSTPHTVRNSVGKDRASVNSSSESVNIHSTDSSVSKAYTCKTPTFKMWQTNPVSQTSVTKSIMKPSPLQRAITFTNNLKKIPFQNLKRADSEPKEVKLPVPGQSKKADSKPKEVYLPVLSQSKKVDSKPKEVNLPVPGKSKQADSKPKEVNLPVPGQSKKVDSKPKELKLPVNTRSVLFGQSSASFESYCKTYKDRKAHDLLPYNHLIDSAVRLDLNDTGFGLIENTEQIGDSAGPKYDVMGENKTTPTKAISDRQSVELNRNSMTNAVPVVQKPPNDKIVYCSQPVTLSLTTITETVVPKPESVKNEPNIVKYHVPLNIKAVGLKSETVLNIINSNNLSDSPQIITTNSVADDKFLDAMFSGKVTQQCGNLKKRNSILSKDHHNSLDNKENGVCPVPSNINRSESTQQCGNFKTPNNILSKDNGLDNKENGVCPVPPNINRSESTQQCGNFKKSNNILSKDNSLDNKENGVCPVPSNINRSESTQQCGNFKTPSSILSKDNSLDNKENGVCPVPSNINRLESTQQCGNFKTPNSILSKDHHNSLDNKENGVCPVPSNINRSESTQQCGNFKTLNSILSKDNSLDNKENGVCPVLSNINRSEANSTPLDNINSNHFQSQQTLKSSSDNKLSDSSGSESVTQDLVNFKMPKSVNLSQEKDQVNKEKGLCPVQVNSSGMRTLTIGSNSYIIQRKLGEGGSSVVHLTLQSDNRKPRAVKVVNMAVGEALAKGYLNEVKLLSKLQGSDRVVKMYDYVHSPSHKVLYMVMECGDSDLNQIIKKSQATENKYLPIVTLVDYWLQMLEAVQYIHNNGVIHSDLKPANFLCVKGRLKLIDFGIASSINNDMTSVNVYVQAGTFNYMSPEALQDASGPNSPLIENQYKCKISYKSDVWSLGCILYLLLYGCTPFGHINRIFLKVAAITDPILKIKYGDLPFYPPVLVQTVKKCLVHDPKARPSVTELLELPRAPFSCPHRMQ